MPAPGEDGEAGVKAGSRPPWVGLGAAVWVQMAAGSGYTFPLYSHSLKSALGLTQQQLTILGVANDVGENVGVLPGVACNRLPPWAVLLIGAACSFVGFGALWLAVTRTLTSIPYWMVCAPSRSPPPPLFLLPLFSSPFRCLYSVVSLFF